MNLNISDYNELLAGGDSGAAVIPGDPDGSLVIQKQTTEQPHFAQLTPDELLLMIDWIDSGAPER